MHSSSLAGAAAGCLGPGRCGLIREAVGIAKGATAAGRERAGSITDAQVAQIATVKLPDLNTDDLDAAKRQVAGTARSMGIAVEG